LASRSGTRWLSWPSHEEQQSRWLPAVADGSVRFCFALTEPEAGSNAARMQITAVRTPGGWRINGQKTALVLTGTA
jgi:alkylation response protein AidB-like acyl-CoA dehydrogenase